MEDIKPAERNRVSIHKLTFGLVLLAFGVLAFVDAIDVWEPRQLWHLWPVAVILIGLSSEVDALIARRGDGGSFLIGFGLWMLAGTYGFFGLSYRTAFPLGIAVVGLFMTLHALVDKPQPPKTETHHEPC